MENKKLDLMRDLVGQFKECDNLFGREYRTITVKPDNDGDDGDRYLFKTLKKMTDDSWEFFKDQKELLKRNGFSCNKFPKDETGEFRMNIWLRDKDEADALSKIIAEMNDTYKKTDEDDSEEGDSGDDMGEEEETEAPW